MSIITRVAIRQILKIQYTMYLLVGMNEMLSKSLKELNVSASAFPRAFRRQLDLQEIDQNFYNVVLGTNFTV